MSDTVLQVEDLRTYFRTDDGVVKAVDGVSFSVRAGEIVGIVGESGCGKSVTSLSVMRLVPSPPGKIVGGRILFQGKDLLELPEKEMRGIRGKDISMIFQDPMTSLNPFLRISTQMIETIRLHQGLEAKAAREKAVEMLSLVGIPSPHKRIDAYPHQFSGGMRQRVMIAMALSCNPKILIADEPTTALDVTIQAQILDLMKDLAHRFGTSVILITHDLGVVAGMCNRVHVMYAGRIVEEAPVDRLFASAAHPYTSALINSVPRLDKPRGRRLFSIPGQPPNLIDLPECCPFYPRCPKAMDVCKRAYPPETVLEDGHTVKCWLYAEEGSR
ncbi:ABC transporter ATP-binding protein [Spirochaeta thermophila]|uniref:Oligopeptide/dipeptide ABC transporter, ATP-binding protein-like protein n=1 Tax=Winmispira thermophila (strain ATCC 49972 / DSM 6192 / RI 19.B1) TaxID=665571 RepID=E0RNX9_WINT6|nr:ABC transporter ATP-binding protein [Spirochaeta thermophila]ADN01252.1 oligopeptide/dipeptide ABC transporter, ATP-binding protein-like protein [Spirochaeta thermophila DSM 6192]